MVNFSRWLASLKPLGRAFYASPIINGAQSLLGQSLVSTISNNLTLRITLGTETYLVDDSASHTYRQ